MDLGDISVTNDATKCVTLAHVIDYIEPAHHVIMDIQEVSVTDNTATGVRVAYAMFGQDTVDYITRLMEIVHTADDTGVLRYLNMSFICWHLGLKLECICWTGKTLQRFSEII